MRLKEGFTLIELLTVVSIIGVMSSVVLTSINSSRQIAKISQAESQLRQISNAMQLLSADTGKWPNGCPAGEWENPEVYLDDPWAGLTSIIGAPGTPVTGSGPTRNSCSWTSQDLANWRGPYIRSIPLDPWGNRYLFDPDYCDEYGRGTAMLVSFGPNGVEEYKTDCGLNNYFDPHGPPPGDDVVLNPGSSFLPIP